ncbi:hypothetical protein LEP1GSC161_2309 [Leptospira santarosai str. CBC1416]|uniref:Uncharacterized protein n=1 Tax=Leptospira santarosai str. CBC1416 TaxID=1193059 RepID=M6VWY2_9LEPT|nr:hypothetical protein LEP1GSC168_1032 [Leptospira santarosai str. HAI134]EMO57519.1 hypothetical protein LEP1GSC161_2309 [Leptospira santarosai str. CBC1416]EMO73112.1 hypothetical protein LEP1GSC130_2217 [Leptospira santarosai str. 200403458]
MAHVRKVTKTNSRLIVYFPVKKEVSERFQNCKEFIQTELRIKFRRTRLKIRFRSVCSSESFPLLKSFVVEYVPKLRFSETGI